MSFADCDFSDSGQASEQHGRCTKMAGHAGPHKDCNGVEWDTKEPAMSETKQSVLDGTRPFKVSELIKDPAVWNACRWEIAGGNNRADWKAVCWSREYADAIAERLNDYERVAKERDTALANADFWHDELNNFRRNAAHRAEQLAAEKIEKAEQELDDVRKALETRKSELAKMMSRPSRAVGLVSRMDEIDHLISKLSKHEVKP